MSTIVKWPACGTRSRIVPGWAFLDGMSRSAVRAMSPSRGSQRLRGVSL